MSDVEAGLSMVVMLSVKGMCQRHGVLVQIPISAVHAVKRLG
jgi:hypothetical protein